MLTTITNRKAQRVSAIEEWIGAKSETFSRLCGEDFTHGEVIVAHLAVVAVMVVCSVAEWLEGGAL